MARDFLVDINMNSNKVTSLANPTSAQDAATKAYVDANIEGISWKDAVRAASTADVNLAAPGTTIDGITMATNDRFLAKNQTAGEEGGIYVFNGSATPATRAADASTWLELEGAVVSVEEGTANAGTQWRQTAVNGTLETDDVLWTSFGTASPSASETTAGIAELATQGEADTGTDDTRIVTPLKMATWSGRKRKASGTVGDSSATSFNIDHNFGMREVVVQVYRNSGNYDSVECDVTRPTTNRVTLTFASAPTSNQFGYVILG